MLRTAARYIVLAVLFVFACLLNGGEFLNFIRELREPRAHPASPFAMVSATRTIGSGPFSGDQLLAINGAPLRSIDQFNRIVSSSRPGDNLRLTLSLPSGRVTEQFVTIPDVSSRMSPGRLVVNVCTKILIPITAIVLGFGVAALRPFDPNAWFLLAMLLGFVEMFVRRDWRGPMPDLALIWNGVWTSLAPSAMAWFGLRFAEPFSWERKRPWMRWLFTAGASAAGFFYFGVLILWHHDINAAQVWRGELVRAWFLWLAFALAGISVFFTSIGAKIGLATSDAKRRLRILYFGAAVAFSPMLGIVVYALFARRDLFDRVPWPVTAFAFITLALFPLTLAYVIVVERAMDLRFVIRRGIQYAVAKGGLYAVRFGAVSYAFYVIARNLGRPGHEVSAAIQLTTIGLALVILGRRTPAGMVSRWIDRKFFREAYDAEKVLSELANEAGRFVEIKPLLEKVATRISDTLHVPDIVILLRDGNLFRTSYSTRPGEPLDIPASSAIVAAFAAKQEPLRVWFDKPPAWLRALDGRDLQTLDFMRTQLLLPIPGKEGLAGIMSLGPKLSEAPYSRVDIRLTQSIAAQMGLAVQNSRLAASLAAEAAARERLNREIEIAREVQERLFPQALPSAPGIDCGGYCRPARGVGGDYYDFLRLEGGGIGIAVGDVSGKGIAAALLMASLQASLRGQAAAGNHDLASLMHNVNRLVYEASTENRYATFFYGEYDPVSRNLRFVNAGHNAPMLFRGDEVIRLEATGTVVGLLSEACYEQQSCALHPGDLLIGFTDGITEAQNEADQQWEEARMIETVRTLRYKRADEIISGVFFAADDFTASAPQFDDMTLIVVKIGTEPAV